MELANDYIKLKDCVHGGAYRLSSRNLKLGIYNAPHRSFIGIREKHGYEFLDVEYHKECGGHCATASPKQFLEQYPFDYLSSGQSIDGKWLDNKEMFSWLMTAEEKHIKPD